jgi:hypothetical protein
MIWRFKPGNNTPKPQRDGYVQRRLAELRRLCWQSRDGHRVLKPSERLPLDADYWNAPAISILTIPELLALPEIGSNARRAGVYFLFAGHLIQYIGSSHNVRTRVLSHDFPHGILFDKATYMPVQWPWQLAVEAMYIKHYKPSDNSNYAGKDPSVISNAHLETPKDSDGFR